jgi:hypothetical protein
MDEDRILGSWRVKSGNVCYAALVLDAHRAVNIRFTWNRPPIAEDYQDFDCTVRPEAIEYARQIVMRCADVMRTIQDLVADGRVEQIGTTVDGEPIWGVAKAKSSPRSARGEGRRSRRICPAGADPDASGQPSGRDLRFWGGLGAPTASADRQGGSRKK